MTERREKNQESPKFPEPKPHQFSKLTLDEAIAQHEAGLLTSTGLIYHAVKIYRQDGRRLRLRDVTAFYKRLNLPRSTFYRALIKLSEANVNFHWEPEDGLTLWFEDDAVPDIGHQSQKLDGQSLKPATSKASSASSDIYSDSYQIFIKSLSDSERKNFEKFGLKKAALLPNPPQLPQRWIEANWQELASQFKNTPEATAAATEATDWTQHPDWESWLAHMREGVPKFVALGTCFDWKKRRAIADWADERGLIWGAET